MFDLLVAGAGPAGLLTALHAARAGLRVAVHDPRLADGAADGLDKACGEGLMPHAVADLAALGVRIGAHHPFVGIRYIHTDAPDQHADSRFPDGPGWGVRRLALSRALLEATEAAGVDLQAGRVADVVQGEGHIEAGGVRARWLVAADGLRSSLRHALGLDDPRPARAWPRRYGLRQHWHVAPWSNRVEVWWADDVEAYVTPVDDDTVGIALLFGDGARAGDGPPWERLLGRFPALRERLAGCAPASHLRGAGPFATGSLARSKGRVLLVGDAAGYLDPLTGEGVRLGAHGAAAAVDAILHGDTARYERAWKQHFRRYAWATGGLLLATRPAWARRALVPLLQRAPWIMNTAIAHLAT